MAYGIVLTVLGVILYFVNRFLIFHFIKKNSPGTIDSDFATRPLMPAKYEGKRTAGKGVVPKWVSWIGLLAVSAFIIGLIINVYNLIF